MRLVPIIIVLVLTLTFCSKKEVLPISVVNFRIGNQKYETKLYRLAKIRWDQSDLFCNYLTFVIDSLEYNDLKYNATFRMRAIVNYRPESTSYSHELSSISAYMVNKSDSSTTSYSSEICKENSFELVINDIEWIDAESGYYSGRFHGELCDSNQTVHLIIEDGQLIRARL